MNHSIKVLFYFSSPEGNQFDKERREKITKRKEKEERSARLRKCDIKIVVSQIGSVVGLLTDHLGHLRSDKERGLRCYYCLFAAAAAVAGSRDPID